MSSYDENREQNLEIKYLRKVLCDIDRRMPLPDSLRAVALLPKLDGIKTPAQKESNVRFVFPKGWFTLSSGITYAAAFLLIVGLFYGMGFNNRQDLVIGGIPIAPSEVSPEFSAAHSVPEELPELMIAAFTEDDDSAADEGGTPKQESPQVLAEQTSEGAQPNPVSDTVDNSAPVPFVEGVGGSGRSIRLGTYEGYVLSYRHNDKTDPDREAEAPLVLELLDAGGSQIVSQIDLPYMTGIDKYLLFNETVVLVGSDSDNVITYSIDFGNVEEPEPLGLLEQPGSFKDARIYKDMLHIASYSPQSEDLNCKSITLPDSESDGVCVITALNLADEGYNQVAFLGVDEDIKIYNLNAYLYYGALPEDEIPGTLSGEDTLHIAQVRLNGLDIELGGISK